ncbi:MAG: hypothetical protein L0K86_24640, partial [Actinomycetia bacterium]|nr:hypothetical protein [Actinomycetes bacterium]
RLLERDISLDVSQQTVTDDHTVALTGHSSTGGLAAHLRWIPLTEPVTIPIVLVLPAVEATPTAEAFARVAQAHAATHHWLDPAPS